MVDPQISDAPQPGDLVHLHPGTAGTDPATQLIIADIVEDEPGTYVLWHLDSHPDYQDWAAAVTRSDIALIIRTAPGSVRTWTPSP
ncbi:DUF6211 family protein [Streptomyces sp. NPDC012746]|uniref:DUF6211 family protein n=1 Tax=Streptomyces sp. NPDC012746 TaxID=3364845 RepID=UPI0036CC36D4